MEIASITIEEYMGVIKQINATLADGKRFEAFLNSATKEMPLIGDILEQIALLNSFPESSQKEKGLTAAHRDLVVLLALRQLEKKKQ